VDGGLYETATGGVYVGMDPSVTAFAVSAVARDGSHFNWVCNPTGTGVRRLLAISRYIDAVMGDLKDRFTVREICLEGYAPGAKFSREIMGEVSAIARTRLVSVFGWDDRVGYPTMPSPHQLKKFATGKANIPKDNVLLAVYKKWGVELSDNNMADAFTLAKIAEALHTDETALAYEREVMTALATRRNPGFSPGE
jgi:hypothetical protein